MADCQQFWKGALASASQSLDLVLDKTRTQASTLAPRSQLLLEGLTEQLLQGASTVADTPTAVALLAAFHAYVSRISSQEVITFGVQPSLLLASSAAVEQAPLVPLSCPPVGPNDTITSHASKLQQQLQGMVSYSQVPLAQICAAAGIEPASSMQHPLFQAGVVVASSIAAAEEAAAGLDLVLVLVQGSGSERSSFFGRRQPAAQVYLVYNSGLFTAESAELMGKHFQVFLTEVTKGAGQSGSPQQPLLAAALMDSQERELVLREFNNTDLDFDQDTFVHTLFAQHAKANPKAPCVVYEDCVFTYEEIDAASNRIANYLRNKAGVTPGSMVAVLVLRSPVMIATLLGVMKAGAGYLPLDHHHPEGRIEFMLEDAAVKAVLVQPDLVKKLPDAAALQKLGIHTLLLHPEVPFLTSAQRPKAAAAAAAAGGFAPVVPAGLDPACLGAAASESAAWEHGQVAGPETTCYIIYTSGSTGKPKGVVVMHKGLTAYIAWFRTYFGITAQDVFIQKTPTNFDASMDEIWTSLSAGATLVVAPPEAHRDVHSVMMLITRHSVTTASAVPSQLQMLAREILALHGPGAAAAGQAPCSSLKQVLSGGEALTTTMAQDINAAMPRCRLFNTYGPTETTVGITASLYQPPQQDEIQATDGAAPVAATIPIGNGIYNSRLYVLDSQFKPVPVGVPGELYISGIQVAWGYLNRPDLNEKMFLSNPFCEGPGTHTDRMYKAGDLVRWLPGQHACLEFLGRVDHQVKLRGFRIELQEIEAALGALPGVSQVATALAKNPTTNQDQLVAWVSPQSLDSQSLVQQLQGMLPEYMIPTVVVRMDQLPLLPSEKVNRKALPAPDFVRDGVKPPVKASAAAISARSGPTPVKSSSVSGSSSSSGSSSPVLSSSRSSSPGPSLDPLMLYIAEVWADVLGSDSASLDPSSDFFGLGGNSLLCGRMNSRIRASLGVPGLSGMLIYQNTSLAEFAQSVAMAGAVLPSGYGSSLAKTSTSNSLGSSEEDRSPGSSQSFGEAHALQHFIAEAWADALGIEGSSLGPEDDFFALGGNSLLCGRMNSRLRSGLNIPSMSGMLIYQHTTLGAFTEAVAAIGAMPPPCSLANSSSLSAAVSHSHSPSMEGMASTHIDTIPEGDTIFEFIASVWAESLGVERSSLTSESDFFGLGGNSLLCGRMNSRLRVGLNLPGLSGMLIYQHTSLAAFVDAVTQAGPTVPAVCSGSFSRPGKGGFDSLPISRQGSWASVAGSSSSFRIGAPSVAPRVPSGFSAFTNMSNFSSWTSHTSNSHAKSGGSFSSNPAAATAAAIAAQAAAASYTQQHASSRSMSPSMTATATKAAYAAAAAAYNTVMAAMGYDSTGSGKHVSALDLNSPPSNTFSKHFSIGAGAAGGAAIPAYDAVMANLSSFPSFAFAEAGGKGSVKPALLPQGYFGDDAVPASEQVKPSVALCTLLQIVTVAFITGASYGLTLLPMLGWMWLLAVLGYKAIPLLPLLSIAVMLLGLCWTVMGKWLFIGRYKEGQHPIWGWYYLRHWVANQFISAARSSYLPLIKRTTLINWFWRSLGVKIGKNVMISTDDFLGCDLIELKDNSVLDMFCGITAITLEAGKPTDKFPTGKMEIRRVSVGAGAVVGAHGVAACCDVPDGAVVQPCTSASNPPAVWKGTRWPQQGPEAVVAAKSQDQPLGILSGLLALIITWEFLAIVTYPILVGFLLFWVYLSGYSMEQLPEATADTLQCFINGPWNPVAPGASAKCNNLMLAAIKSMLLYPTGVFVAGQLLVLAVIPYKWLVRGRGKPDAELTLQPGRKSWWERFRSHLLQVMVDHPAIKVYLYMWTGTAVFNAWLRAMGSKVGKQAWIGEGLQLFEHDLVEIGDCVSICSEVSMMPSTAMGARKICIKGGSDVTNQTCVYPGVTVQPGACLGVFTYAEAERTFPRDSIVQGPMVLMPGRPEPEEGGPAVTSEPGVTRLVSSWQYFKFNMFYTLLMLILLPLTIDLSTLPFFIATTVLAFKFGMVWAALLVPVSYILLLTVDILWMMVVKKILLRRCQGNNPFYEYTHTAWMITGILLYFHQTSLMKTLSGSQMAVWYYRAMGAKIGKGVVLNSLASNEPDCLTIGDGTIIDDMSFVMAHTTENRCVKFHDVYIGKRVTIGCGSAVMPGCVVNDDAVIGDVSIVMKGETIPAGAVWRGVPAVPVLDHA